MNRWENDTITASDKRILITKFVGEAWDKIFNLDDFSPDIYFERTGCLLTLDGSEDHLVKIEGMPDYKPSFVQHNDDDSDSDVDLPVVANAAPEPSSDMDAEDDSDIDVEQREIGNADLNLDMIMM